MPPPQSFGFIPGCPLVENNNETFCIYAGAFWVLGVRFSLGSRKVYYARTKKQRTATLPTGPSKLR